MDRKTSGIINKGKRRAPPPPFPSPPPLQPQESAALNVQQITPPPPPPILPVQKEGGDGVLGPEEKGSRGAGLRKREKQSCELYIDVPRQPLLKQIQQGVQLKPVSCC